MRNHLQLSLLSLGLSVGLGVAAVNCSAESFDDSSAASHRSSSGSRDDSDSTTNADGTPKTPAQQAADSLAARKVDYGEALRTASLKLVGELPTIDQINSIAGKDPAAAKPVYEAAIDTMLADGRFEQRLIAFFRNTLATGEQTGATKAQGAPSFDTAATFAAMTVVQDKPYTDLFTATTGTCATYAAGAAGAKGTFTATACTGTRPTAGILSDPGLMSQFFANMAFRRVRLVNEKFACNKMPVEFAAAPTPMGAGSYTSPWKFDSITGGTAAKINFQDTSSVICANCHTTLNHLAPLFANFDANGAYTAGTIQVITPVPNNPKTVLTDWLPAGETTAWRNGVAAADIPALGAAMAKDDAVLKCGVSRAWNWALSKGDVVDDVAPVPDTVIQPYFDSFKSNGLKLKPVIAAIFKGDDFTKF